MEFSTTTVIDASTTATVAVKDPGPFYADAIVVWILVFWATIAVLQKFV